jgi:hypothetical protein
MILRSERDVDHLFPALLLSFEVKIQHTSDPLLLRNPQFRLHSAHSRSSRIYFLADRSNDERSNAFEIFDKRQTTRA